MEYSQIVERFYQFAQASPGTGPQKKADGRRPTAVGEFRSRARLGLPVQLSYFTIVSMRLAEMPVTPSLLPPGEGLG